LRPDWRSSVRRGRNTETDHGGRFLKLRERIAKMGGGSEGEKKGQNKVKLQGGEEKKGPGKKHLGREKEETKVAPLGNCKTDKKRRTKRL